MYLARKRVKGRTCYFIRESFYEGRVVKSRDLFDLGSDPEDYIIYPDDGHAFYFDEGLCEALEEKGVPPDNDRLEKVFWPFIDPEARRQIEAFTRPPAGRGARLFRFP